jgi:hypothetical protein
MPFTLYCLIRKFNQFKFTIKLKNKNIKYKNLKYLNFNNWILFKLLKLLIINKLDNMLFLLKIYNTEVSLLFQYNIIKD